jgi:hypothetical protein
LSNYNGGLIALPLFRKTTYLIVDVSLKNVVGTFY